MNDDPNISLIFAQEIASILGREVQEWPDGFYIDYSSEYCVFIDGAEIGIFTHYLCKMLSGQFMPGVCDLMYQFSLADPDISPETIVEKAVELDEAFIKDRLTRKAKELKDERACARRDFIIIFIISYAIMIMLQLVGWWPY